VNLARRDGAGRLPDSRDHLSASHEWSSLAARMFWAAFLGIMLAAIVLVGYFGHQVYLFADDYVYLYDARLIGSTFDLLTTPLFGHFTPVGQLANAIATVHLPAHPWLVRAVLLALTVGVIAAVGFLMLSLFGRTWPTLIGTAVAGPTLSMLPLVNWWTAGVNIIPALIGVALCLGAMARLVRGESIWYASVAIGGSLLAVLDWEPGMTAVGYAGLWTLLFRSRVTEDSLRQVVRRTWWVWAVLILIAALSALNFRLNYYQTTPAPTLPLVGEALATSAFTVQLPLTLGFYDPSRPGFELIGSVIGVIALVGLMIATVLRSRRAWRGWIFAFAGWFVPVLAVTLPRVGYIGVRAIEQPLYYYLPTFLLVVGVLEAWVAPRARSANSPEPRRHMFGYPRAWALGAGAVTALALASAWLSSAWPTISSTNYDMMVDANEPERGYMDNLVGSAHDIQASGTQFSVINGVAPAGMLNFQGHNRLSQVTGVHDPSIPFDAPDGPWYVPDETGTLVPATIQWQAELTAPAVGLATNGTTAMNGGTGFCFTVDAPDAALRWDLPAPVAGGAPVVRTMATVAAATPVRVSTVTNPGDPPVVTNVNPRTWTPDETGRLDTTAEPQISSVVIDSMTVGTSMCLTSIQVGTVSAS
jgi:hypothetical protein